jgi:thiol-disulfide isomerase/thioredoxin
MLESLAGQLTNAIGHFQEYLTLPQNKDFEERMNRLSAQSKLREAFAVSGLTTEAEKYYASDPTSLGLFYSEINQPDRALEVYERFLASNPPPDRARIIKSIILITLGEMKRVEEMATRLAQYQDDLTPNAIVNNYSTLSRVYYEAGNQAKSDQYTALLFDYGKKSKAGKAVDGPLVAHIDWIIKRYEGAGEVGKLEAFLKRVRAELAVNKSVMAHLERREVYDAVLNKPAKELEMAYFLNGKQTNLKELNGRVVLLDFFSHWCGPCIEGFPFMRSLQSKYEEKGLTILGISGIYGYYKGVQSLTPEQEIQRMRDQFASEYRVTWPMVFGRTKTNNENYGVGYIPHLVIVDRKGIVRYAKIGKPNEEELEQQVVKLLREPSSE